MANSERNFYEILNATSSASFGELKSKYKQLILQFHPDKLLQQLEIETNDLKINNDANNDQFVAITEAWNCLKDPVTRKQYDAEQLLNKFHTHNNIYARIKLSEMKKQTNTGDFSMEYGGGGHLMESVKDEQSKYLYTYECRCGGQYIVDDSAEQYCSSSNNHDTQISNRHNNAEDDDADNKRVSGNKVENNKSSTSTKYENNDGDCRAGGNKSIVQDQVDIDEEFDGELIVECSECSLVIILLNG